MQAAQENIQLLGVQASQDTLRVHAGFWLHMCILIIPHQIGMFADVLE